jgi:hypothetical protein
MNKNSEILAITDDGDWVNTSIAVITRTGEADEAGEENAAGEERGNFAGEAEDNIAGPVDVDVYVYGYRYVYDVYKTIYIDKI